MDLDVEDEPELPTEFRIMQSESGYCLVEVYLKDGKPWSYDDNWTFTEAVTDTFEDREDLNAALAMLTKGIHEAASAPVLNEETDFPGQERFEIHSFTELLKHPRQSAD